jgi:hypothetical protein
LVITFFLRGDLGERAPTGHYDDLATDKTSRPFDDPLDVRQIWRLIFRQLQSDLQAERAKKTQAQLSLHIPTTSANMDNNQPSTETDEQEKQDADIDIADVLSSGDFIPDPLSQFLVRALPVQETDQRRSRRLIPEVCFPCVQSMLLIVLFVVISLFLFVSSFVLVNIKVHRWVFKTNLQSQ